MNNAELQELWERVPVPLLVLGPGARLAGANPAAAALLGLPLEELLGLTTDALVERVVLPGDAAWLRGAEAERLAGARTPSPESWVWVRGPGGAERLLKLATTALSGGRWALALLDPGQADAERRLTEALAEAAGALVRLRDEAEVLREAAEALFRAGFSVAAARLTPAGVERVAVRLQPAFGAALAGAGARPAPGSAVVGPGGPPGMATGERALFFQDVRPLVARTFPVAAEAVHRALPGLRAILAPLAVGGEPYGTLTVLGEQLTPLAAAALELFARALGGALENVRHHAAARARVAELERLQQELVARERLAALGEAAAVVAHEVRNPLGAVLNALAVLKRESRLSPDGARMTAVVEEEATRLNGLVGALLDLARPLTPRLREVELGRLLAEAVRHVGAEAGGRARLVLEAGGPLPLQADPALLALAVENLLRNAVQASPPGGEVRLRLEPRPGGAVLAVEDQGPGVPEAHAARIFEPFFTTRASGTGLGLAVVKRVVDAHGGRVAVRRREGGGARFEIELGG